MSVKSQASVPDAQGNVRETRRLRSTRGQQGLQRAVELGTHKPTLHIRPLSPLSREPGIPVCHERGLWAAYA
jgi:hypothetical protein